MTDRVPVPLPELCFKCGGERLCIYVDNWDEPLDPRNHIVRYQVDTAGKWDERYEWGLDEIIRLHATLDLFLQAIAGRVKNAV